MQNEKFFESQELGKLMMDRIFFAGNYPILFSCEDESDNIYLCVCCQNTAQIKKWLMVRTTFEAIIELLQDEVTIRDAFLREKTYRYSIIYTNGIYHLEKNNKDDWNELTSIYLPTEGEYMDAEDGEFDEDIAYYRSEILAKLLTSYTTKNLKDDLFVTYKKQIVLPPTEYKFSISAEDFVDMFISKIDLKERPSGCDLDRHSENVEYEKSAIFAA